MSKLILVRHGQANNATVDHSKGLSETGLNEIGKMAKILQNIKFELDEVRHSGKTRARQTAEILAGAIGCQEKLVKVNVMMPSDPPENIIPGLRQTDLNLMLVGHMPFMGELASRLVSGGPPTGQFSFETGAMLCLHKQNDLFSVEFYVSPRLVGHQSGESFRSYH